MTNSSTVTRKLMRALVRPNAPFAGGEDQLLFKDQAWSGGPALLSNIGGFENPLIQEWVTTWMEAESPEYWHQYFGGGEGLRVLHNLP